MRPKLSATPSSGDSEAVSGLEEGERPAGDGDRKGNIPPEAWFFLALWIGVQRLWTAVRFPVALSGAQIDPDGYMRLVMVERLLATGEWFGVVLERSNWPHGEVHHWTRPLDVLILLLALPFRVLGEWREAVALAGSLISPLLHLATCLVAAWVIRPLVPGRERFLAMPAMLVQLVVLAFGTAGRADHHALIVLVFTLIVGTWLRAILEPDSRRWPALTGGLAALGIWVSPELLLPLAFVFASGGLAWLLDGSKRLGQNRALVAALVGGLAVAMVLQHGPASFLAVHYDQVALPHLTMAGLALLFWVVAGLASTTQSRVGLVALGAPLTGLALLRIHPGFFRGPWADADPVVLEGWLQHVYEFHPLFPTQVGQAGSFLMVLGGSLALLPFVLLWAREGGRGPRGQAWLFVGVSLGVCVALAAWQTRFGAYSGVLTALVAVEAIRRVRVAIGRRARTGPAPLLARVGATAGILMGPILLGGVAEALTPLPGTANGAASSGAEATAALATGCPVGALATVLAEPDGWGARPRTIATFLDFGPELLYRTPHRVLAGPYHRNDEGIMDSWRLFTTTEEAEARRLVEARQVELLLLCPARDENYYGRVEGPTLYRDLRSGSPPPWLTRRPLESELDEAFLLFEVRPPGHSWTSTP
jgi:hypothetical protein